ncbi:hypothetical protein [Rubrobacter aplysinae]|uniref:hypothetical protein n=1 Tax=Rubrobacter aplysinae TaxID=909625 RepID=UPI00069FB932|nr:hypothetical protein [Rubrobacter aplysinae]
MREEFMIQRQGKQFVLFAGLLNEAHSRGLVGIDTELIQVPEDSNGQVAIVKATVQIEENPGSGELKTYSGIGDASPQNVSRNIVPHLIRMSETRAKARALRDAVNVSAAALEEVVDSEEGQPGSSGNQGQSNSSQTSAQHKDQSARNSSNVRDLPRQSAGGQTSDGQRNDDEESSSQVSKNREQSKAPKSQIDFIKTLAEEWRGQNGVERLEQRIGKSLSQLSRSEAEEWIDRLTPKDSGGEERAAE